MDFTLANQDLEKKILTIERSSQTRTSIYSQIIVLCRKLLETFRHQISSKNFKNYADEIVFFKLYKQIPLTYLIFYVHLRKFEAGLPIAGEPRRLYVEKKIKKTSDFFTSNKEFVQYIDLSQEHLDKYYFTRRYNSYEKFSDHCSYYEDPNFSTSKDILLGELRAYRKLLPFLQNCLIVPTINSNKLNNQRSELQWTASKTALIELIYALQQTGSFNNGTADLVTIATSFEDFFQIKLDNFYKTYSEIKLRKGRRTKFLDELAWRFERKLEGDEKL